MPDNVEILEELIDVLKTDVINSMQSHGRYATGQTIKELTEVVGDNYAALLAPQYIDALEYGRKPTSPGAAASDPPLIDRIKEWLAAKGFDYNPYAVTKNIHKRGYPGKPGVLTEPLSDDNINNRLKNTGEQLANNQATAVLAMWDDF